MNKGMTCLVTIHGIGFQQAPGGGAPGYADGLHDSLKAQLPDLLGSDPLGEFDRKPGTGAIYVHSDWPLKSRDMAGGLARIGKWKENDPLRRAVDPEGAPLAEGDFPIAHIALVYSHLEDQGPHLGASLETLAKAVVSQAHYASVASIVKMGMIDIWSVIKHHKQATAVTTPSLQVRSTAITNGGTPAPQQDGSGAFAVIGQLDRDVATYVCRNDLRERVRSFVHDVILMLCCRDDVANVVVNSHSQGTVLAYDVVRTLPPFAADQVKWLVTAGSPLRKYVDLFYWGTDAACITKMQWTNFWDETDPVADPLIPPADWHRGHPIPDSPGHSLLYGTPQPDSDEPLPAPMEDVKVSNVAHGAGGGLPAHNYWDNNTEFVVPLAGILKGVVGSPVATPA